MTPLRLEAPAKLNLSLQVVGRRVDGFHELDSEFVLLELADRLLLLPGCSGLRVEPPGTPDVPLGADNLAWRGLVAGLGEEPMLVCLALEKRIPAGGGLAGGSSDAAAAWRLGRAWAGRTAGATADDLAALASIGADVPFFAAAVPAARVRGLGERVEPSSPRRLEAVLVHPPFGLSTAAVFAELRPDEHGRADNDLLAPARRLRPELDAIFAAVQRAGGDPRLSGSGSTVFAVTPDPERADAVAASLSADGLTVTRTRTRMRAADIEFIEEEENP
jgi:4-diphosphocytidyl-2-C-methyl-D-erythritol kinase